MKIDPQSTRIALHYTGTDAGEPAISGVPARDLTEHDVARLVYVDHGDISGAAHAAATDKLVTRLTDGPYRKTEPDKARKPVKAADPTPAVSSVDSTEGEL